LPRLRCNEVRMCVVCCVFACRFQNIPQRLKPHSVVPRCGTTKVVPFQNCRTGWRRSRICLQDGQSITTAGACFLYE
jgi:hypothetical protein